MPKPRDETNRQYYAKRTASLERRYCTQCDRQLRSDSTREICRTCWRKSDEGKEYLRQMKVKSRGKTNEIR